MLRQSEASQAGAAPEPAYASTKVVTSEADDDDNTALKVSPACLGCLWNGTHMLEAKAAPYLICRF
jgi:hypothetical protein